MTSKEDLRNQRIAVTMHTIIAIVIGVLSIYMGNAVYAFGAAIAAGIATGHVAQKIVGKQKFSWWLGNGFILYLLVWFDMWIFMANYF